MNEWLTMNTRDLDRLRVIQMVVKGTLTWKLAAAQLQVSERQIGNLCARVRREGPRGILHRLRGRPSNRRLPARVVARALALVRQRYHDFGPTFAAEHLRERHGVALSVATLRRVLIQAGLWRPRRERVRHRAWRARRPCVGMLVQVDGSEHAWFEGRGPRCVLVLYIDDATSRLLEGEFVTAEDTLTLMRTTKRYLHRYGRPVAFYVDKDSIYRVNRQPTLEEQLQDTPPLTQFTRAMTELGIAVITAHSPQAKGRVERSFRTHQDRLVKELRLRKIATLPAANAFLWKQYLPRHNARYAQMPAHPIDAHRPLRRTQDVDQILTVRTERTVRADWTVRFRNQWWQLGREQPVAIRPQDKVDIQICLDGTIHLRRKGQVLVATPLAEASRAGVGTRPAQPRGTALPKFASHTWLRSDDRRTARPLGRPQLGVPARLANNPRLWRSKTPLPPGPSHPWRTRILAPRPHASSPAAART